MQIERCSVDGGVASVKDSMYVIRNDPWVLIAGLVQVSSASIKHWRHMIRFDERRDRQQQQSEEAETAHLSDCAGMLLALVPYPR